MLIKKKLTRRDILARLGGSTAFFTLMPLVPRIEAAEADAGTIRRFTYWHEFTMPKDNVVNAGYQASPGPLEFKAHNTPLNEIAHKLIFLRKMRRPQGKTRTAGGPHPSGAHAISGWQGTTPGDRVYLKAATSLDQFISRQLAGKTPITDLRAGLKQARSDVDRGTSVFKGVVQPRYQSPLKMYDDVFKGLNSGGGQSGPSESNLDKLRQRKSILDYWRKDIANVKKRVSHFDKARIDAHTESIRSTEQKLEFLLGSSGSNEGCSVAAEGNRVEVREDIVYTAYSELVSQALTCDLTRVAGMCLGETNCTLTYSFLPSYKNGNFHQSTHGKGSGQAYERDVLNFRAKSVTHYLKKLDAVVEPDGNTLLDNAMFAWLNDVSRNHDGTNDIFCILAGGTGRFKNHGQMVNVGNGDTYNQLQTSMAHYMGYEVEVHGDPKFGGTGVLSNNLFS